MGPAFASHLGGEVVAEGDYTIISNPVSLTGKYPNHEFSIEPLSGVNGTALLKWEGARQNNLKNIILNVPPNVLCVVSGVKQGSGKTTLIKTDFISCTAKIKGEFGGKGGIS